MIKWYGKEVVVKVDKALMSRLNQAAISWVNYLRERVSIPNILMTRVMGRGGRWTKGVEHLVAKRKNRGKSPSRPGEYPRKLSGHLRRNIVRDSSAEDKAVRVGTNVVYGKHLELGTRKMKRRPWLSRGLREFAGRLKSIIGGGV